MTRFSTTRSLFAPGPLALVGLIVLAALTRLLPHPPNFSPVEAIALFGGAYFAARGWALVVPLVAPASCWCTRASRCRRCSASACAAA